MKAWTKTRVSVVLGGQAEERVEVALVGVDAAVGEEADEVEGSSLLRGELDRR